jgi:membrane protein YqaA with SNARE-associated domain
MRIFSFLYNKMMAWARHRHAPYYLFGLSFAESSFFPIPPDVMLAPMVLAKPTKAWNYALGTTIASVLGGILGYFIGMLAFDLIQPYILEFGYESTYLQVQGWFQMWGFWVMFFAGFAFIPYKIFTITAGAMHIAMLPFILGSAVGRGGRFFLVTAIMLWGGPRMEKMVERYIERVGWVIVVLLVLVYVAWHCYSHHSVG